MSLSGGVKNRSKHINRSGVYSGVAMTPTLITNDKILYLLTGHTLQNITYYSCIIPDDFVAFQENGFEILTSRNNSGSSTLVTIATGGVVDGTVNSLDMSSTLTNGTVTMQGATPTGNYTAGDLLLIKVVSNTGSSGSASVGLSDLNLKYVGL